MPPSRSRRSSTAMVLSRELGRHLAGRADAGQAGADDQDVEMLVMASSMAADGPSGLDRTRQPFIISRHGS